MRALMLGSLTPMTARTVWRWLLAGHEVAEVWIDKQSGGVWRRRDRRLRWLAPPWSVTAATRRWGIPLREVGPPRRDPALVAAACRPDIDVIISSCFPFIVPEAILNHFGPRALNLHPALLPRYRGPCPMPAIAYDEALSASGVTLHVMSPELDEGDIVAQAPVAWPADGWFRTWEADLAEAFGNLAATVVPRFLRDEVAATAQTGTATYIRRLPTNALVLDTNIDERRARWLTGSLGRIMPLSVAIEDRLVAVAGEGVTSRPRGAMAPARFSRGGVEVDVADARLTLRPWGRLQRKKERVRELIALARRSVAA